MFYMVLVTRNQSRADDFADAISTGRLEPASVYVIGINDAEAFANALVDGVVEIDEEASAERLRSVQFSEAVGTESSGAKLEDLIAIAKKRVWEIRANGLARRTHNRR